MQYTLTGKKTTAAQVIFPAKHFRACGAAMPKVWEPELCQQLQAISYHQHKVLTDIIPTVPPVPGTGGTCAAEIIYSWSTDSITITKW